MIDFALNYRIGSQESFTRAFKKEYDVAPGRYRKLLRKMINKGESIMVANNNAPARWVMTGETPSDYEGFG